MATVNVLHGDAWELSDTLEQQSVNTIITSPPYWGLRDYGEEYQFGLEPTPDEYIAKLVDLFRKLKPALRDDGTIWLNLGDSYIGTGHKKDLRDPKYKNGRNGQKVAVNNKVDGLKSKDLAGIPWRVALALQADGWYLRQDIIWHKPNAMPEPVRDRCTKAHEYIFLLSKSPKYYFDYEAIKEPAVTSGKRPSMEERYAKGEPKRHGVAGAAACGAGGFGVDENNMRNKRSVWTVNTKPFKGAHFAVFPPDLIEPCVLAGCPDGGTVLDPFFGSGTTAQVALKHNRHAIGFELNNEYIELAMSTRLQQSGLF